MKDFNTFIENYVDKKPLNEASAITFGNRIFPESGWCVILVGGSGSGKGYIQTNALLIDAKVFDVDSLKTLYVNAAKIGKITDEKDGNYDFKNPEDVSTLHKIVKDKQYYNNQLGSFFMNVKESGTLPNIIFDITGKESKDIKRIYDEVHDLGYKISLVWVITNRDIANKQNKSRERIVSDELFHKIHNEVKISVNKFIKTEAGKYIDECWLIFNSTKKDRKEQTPFETKSLHDDRAFKLKKDGNKFTITPELQIRLNDILGPIVKFNLPKNS